MTSSDIQVDAASLSLDSRDVIFTTDGFTVQPLEFPGGDIGSLAVHGTVNDLAVAGAKPALPGSECVYRRRSGRSHNWSASLPASHRPPALPASRLLPVIPRC